MENNELGTVRTTIASLRTSLKLIHEVKELKAQCILECDLRLRGQVLLRDH